MKSWYISVCLSGSLMEHWVRLDHTTTSTKGNLMEGDARNPRIA
ncbi:hypothetical protein ANCCAN_24882 [Ancylostoma caninum]|uniref:Uncharacterized protein n=1 Tax=Ancylostoma caninum TaxID=29170 RepID=A0A368FBC2_ANCCA|nr:hypothetical protein ANCCAN_24882 [Ancylostoma caninum]